MGFNLDRRLFDVFSLYGLMFLNPVKVIGFWLGFVVLQAIAGGYALRLDGERLRSLWLLPLQQVVYRQLMYLVTIQSVITALLGTRQRWQVIRRAGVFAGQPDAGAKSPALPDCPPATANGGPARTADRTGGTCGLLGGYALVTQFATRPQIMKARADRRERQLKAAVTPREATPEQVAELRARLARLEAERRAGDEWEPLITLVRESLEGEDPS
jgi:hypothetical protein